MIGPFRCTGTANGDRCGHRFPSHVRYCFPHFTNCCVECRLASVELICLCHRPTCTTKGVGTVQPIGVNFNEYEAVSGDNLIYTSDAADERSSVDLGGR